MAEQWEGMLEGAAQELKGHLTLDRVTANRGGDEIMCIFLPMCWWRNDRF